MKEKKLIVLGIAMMIVGIILLILDSVDISFPFMWLVSCALILVGGALGSWANNKKSKEKVKRTNPFVLFGRAFKNARKDFWISIQVLVAITIVLAIIFYVVEHTAQPDEYRNVLDAFVWSITRYIGDPGHFSGNGPITLTGRYIDTFIGILKILIFAVPAGLVANGFKKAMEDDKRTRQLEEYSSRLQKAFRLKLCRHTRYRTIPRYVPITTIQANQRMDVKDIMDTIDAFPNFRLRNLATTQNVSEHPQDRLVVEHFPITQDVSYGCKITRESNITIVSTSSVSEAGISNFAYYLALFGGFNYISKEFEVNPDDPTSYYLIDSNKKEEKNNKNQTPLKDFINDLSQLACDDKRWVIFLLSASGADEPVHPTQFHFVHKTNKKIDVDTTTIDEEHFLKLYGNVQQMLEKDFELKSDLDEYYLPVSPKNIAIHINGGKRTNAFTLRIAFSVTVWDDRNIAIARKLADELSKSLLGKEIKEDKKWKEKGFGFGYGGLSC